MISEFINSNAKVISSILIAAQFIFAGLMIISLIILVVLHKLKRSYLNSYLFSLSSDLLMKYSETINRISKKVTIVSIVGNLLIFVLTSKPIMNFILYYVHKYTEVFALLFGAFLACAFGLLSDRVTKKRNRKDNLIKCSRFLYDDIIYIYEAIYSIIENEGSYISKRIKYNENWRDIYAELSTILTNEHYRAIAEIYETVDIINKAMNSAEDLLSIMEDTIKVYKLKRSKLPQYTLDITDVMIDLESLSEGKRPQSHNIGRVISELKIIIFCKKYSEEIEDFIIGELRKGNDVLIKDVQQYVKDKYKKRKFNEFQLQKISILCVDNSKKVRIKEEKYIMDNKKEIIIPVDLKNNNAK